MTRPLAGHRQCHLPRPDEGIHCQHMDIRHQPALSICIPTYNRIGNLKPLIERVLCCESDDIEVVVLDNASTDGTPESLSTIQDRRLTIHRNETNRGVLFNILHVLDKAQGRRAVLLLDKDDLDPAQIPDFVAFLEANPALACGFCEYHSAHADEAEFYAQGMPSLRRIAYCGHHPTGYFFDLDKLRTLDHLNRFGDFEFVGHFPFDFIFAELLITGPGAIYHRPAFHPEREENAAKHKSIGTNAMREDAFFSPRGRLRTSINFSRHIGTLPLTPAEKCDLIATRLLQGAMAATLGYRALMRNEAICAHYHIETRNIGLGETLVTGVHFVSTFFSQAVTRQTVGAPLPVLRFTLTLMQRVLSAIGRRVGRRSPTQKA